MSSCNATNEKARGQVRPRLGKKAALATPPECAEKHHFARGEVTE